MKEWLASCRDLVVEHLSGLSEAELRTLIRLLARLAPVRSGVPVGLATSMKLDPFGHLRAAT